MEKALSYLVQRDANGVHAFANLPSGKQRVVRHVVHHSPDGFEFGYGGSGPADLALSILADYYSESPTKKELYEGLCKCWHAHQDFKWVFLARQTEAKFIIEIEEIDKWITLWKQLHKIERLADDLDSRGVKVSDALFTELRNKHNLGETDEETIFTILITRGWHHMVGVGIWR